MSDPISDHILEQYGIDDIYVAGEHVANERKIIIPISPKINLITSGGMPAGTWMTLTGKPKCGKTTLALHIAAKAQRPEYGEREVFYLDIERRLKQMNLRGTPGLNLAKFHVIRSTKQKILSAQDFLAIAEHILRTIPRCLIIVDSYSALCHAAEQEADIGTPVLGMGTYTLLAQFCRQMSAVVPVMDSNIIGITHIMANIGAFGHAAKTMEKGGNAIIYQGDIKLRAKMFTAWKAGASENAKQIGQIVSWICDFSALGAPGQEIESYIRYGKGVDELYELIGCAVDFGIITKPPKGSWYTVDFLPDKPKIQGVDKMYELFNQNKDAYNELVKRVSGVT
jgi:recombination protein RecA